MPDKFLSRTKIAITGGRGRLAGGLRDFLSAAQYDVELFSRDASSEFQATKCLATGSRLRDFNTVLHLGWSSVPLLSEQSPGIEEKEDIPLLQALSCAATQCQPLPKLVFFSTAAVYGNTGSQPATEESHCQPVGRYATAKLRAEQILSGYPNHCILRITNVFGSGNCFARPQGIIPMFLKAAQTGEQVTIWGDGSAVKDYISAPDLYRAVESVISCDLRGVFNIASGWCLSVKELLEAIELNCGRTIHKTHVSAYPWDVQKSRISSRKLQTATGWKPEMAPQAFLEMLAKQ